MTKFFEIIIIVTGTSLCFFVGERIEGIRAAIHIDEVKLYMGT